MPSAIPIVLLFGPTGTGKTELLEKIFLKTPKIPAEILSADSMQVYRGMDIGTAKPDQKLKERLPHHLLDIQDPDTQFNVGDFLRHGDKLAVELSSRAVLPVLSGGTAYYLKTFKEGLPATPPSSPAIRAEIEELLEKKGAEHIFNELKRLDPLSAERIHPNDLYRIKRALEVYYLSGKPLSSFPRKGRDNTHENSKRPKYRFLSIGLIRPRPELYVRIEQRVEAMFNAGLVKDFLALLKAGYKASDPGLQAIGYKEFFSILGNDIDIDKAKKALDDKETLTAVASLISRNTRRYAKRQETFFRQIDGRLEFQSSDSTGNFPADKIREKIKGFIAEGNKSL